MSVVLWYLVVSFCGWLLFPLAFRLLPGLADRGYSLTRTLGLLLWGYLFWLLTNLGLLFNTRGGILAAFLMVGLVSLWTLRGGGREALLEWLRRQRGLILTVEGLFLAAFAFMALVRAANPEIAGTEKPMELAFINAILRSPTFPPHDPWLAGYAISYYHFGYILAAMLAQLTGAAGSVAFNLSLALVFALSAAGAYGVVYNLLAARQPPGGRPALALPLLAPVFILLVSNLTGILEVIHARGWLWAPDAAGGLSSPFWRWLDLVDLNQPPAQITAGEPTRYLWWWRASRVLQDYNFADQPLEIIDEFPFFSFLLGDLHPHVLAIPFAMLAAGLALNLFLGGAAGQMRLGRLRLELSPAGFALGALALGGLSFLNIWDFPFYVALFSGAYLLRRAGQAGWSWQRLAEWLALAVALILAGAALYLPFYLGFSSQAGGFLPNLIFPTRGAHLWVMFAPLFLPLAAYLALLARRRERPAWQEGFLAAGGMFLLLWALALLFGLIVSWLPVLGEVYIGSLAAPNRGALFAEAFLRRFAQPGGWLTLLGLLSVCAALLWPWREASPAGSRSEQDEQKTTLPAADRFAVLLILLGGLLVTFPEFFFLRDQFGWRMNTIFKFYYQAWLLWGLAASYAAAVCLQSLGGAWRWAYRAGLALLLGSGLVYLVFGLNTKTNGFQPPQGWTLDGAAYLAQGAPDEYTAAQWLGQAPPGVIAEAVGGSYSGFARMATYSGLPNVLGWPGHESQWRGGAEEMGSRQADLERLYCTADWGEAQEILQRYAIDYVVVGALERTAYQPNETSCRRGLNEAKFQRYLTTGFQAGQVTIYLAP